MNKFTYNDNNNVASEINTFNQTTYYNYDDFNRLTDIKDQNKNILTHYEYHFINGPEITKPKIFGLNYNGHTARTVLVAFTSVPNCGTVVLHRTDLTTLTTVSSAGSCVSGREDQVPYTNRSYRYTITCYSNDFPSGITSDPVDIYVNF